LASLVREKAVSLSDDDSLALIAKCLSGRRLEVLLSIARKRQSLGQIAKELGVHRGFLTEAISLLQSQQLVRVVREGRRKIPEIAVDRIVVNIKEAR
jgi:predicted transcriptional regulator